MMEQPKFHARQRVAVSTLPEGRTVIAATTVVDMTFVRAGGLYLMDGRVARPSRSAWFYKVADASTWIREDCLRPIDDDEYKLDLYATDKIKTVDEV